MLNDLDRVRLAARGVASCVVPVLELVEGSARQQQIGTAVVLAEGSRAAIVTAAHVVRGPEVKTVILGKAGKLQRWPAEYGIVVPCDPGLADADIAYVTGTIEDRLPFALHAVPVDRAVPGLKVAPEMAFVCIGYPASRGKVHAGTRTLTSDAFFAITRPIDAELYPRLGVDPRVQLALRYDREKMARVDDKIGIGPKPHGMSGGAVFLASARETEAGKEIVLELAGILTEYRTKPHNALVATRIDCVLDAIAPWRRPEDQTHEGAVTRD